MSDISTEGVTGFVSSFTNSAGSVKDSAAGMVSGAIDGILSMGHSLFTVVSSIGTGIVNTFQQSIPYQIFKSITENQFILAIISAINGKRGQIFSAVSTTASDIVTQLRNNLNSGTIFNLGLMIPKGLSDGMLAGLPQLNATASRMGQIVSDAIRNRLKIQSPSKETYEDGAYVILGAINGMEAYADRLKTTTEDITEQSMLDPIREAIASVNDDGTIDSETQPVIRPVLDLSEIQNGYKQINSLFDEQYRVDMQARMGKMETSSAINPEQIDQIEDAIRSINNDDVINEMETLRNDISNLKDAMTRLQVVMNSGTLVGELVDPMDAALGMKALQNSRGRY
jgi:6-pyruvoyl-tetrahydropterin synthase